MIPSRLNLLSPEKRRHLHSLSNFQFIKNILEITLFILSIGGIILLGGQSVLQDHLDELTASMVTLQNQHAGINRDIKNINLVLSRTEKIQNKYQPITPLIPQIVSALPDEIILKTMTIDKDSEIIQLIGHSPNRDILLFFQQELEKIDWVDSVNLPISQLTEKEDIEFYFSVKLKK